MTEQTEKVIAWQLRVLDRLAPIEATPLTQTPVLVGRSLGCQLRINDPQVSRRQCELWLESGVPQFRNHSRRNPTALNGTPCEQETLKSGDIIGFAGHRLLIESMVRDGAPQADPPLIESTTRIFEDTRYNPSTPVSAVPSPKLTASLLTLFGFTRDLAGVSSVETLVAQLHSHLKTQLGAAEVWLVWPLRQDDVPTIYPAGIPEASKRVPRDLVREVAQNQRGMLKKTAQGMMLAAPLLDERQVIGVVAATTAIGATFAEADLEYLLAVAACAAPHLLSVERLEQLQRDAETSDAPDQQQTLLGDSGVMRTLREQLHRAAEARRHVLLLGESGTGKELAARIIHDASPRSGGPYVALNCAALPADLFESEIFGHEKGAFSGALYRRKGLFEDAHGGTLFLDEVGDLALSQQARMLRAADTGLFRRVGGGGEMQADVRIISATNRPLPDPTGERFRLDLFHRLAGVTITLPPLRERSEDIPTLARHFLRLASPHSRAKPREFSSEAMEELQAYTWPGNVRELRNIVERECFLAAGSTITRIQSLLSASHQTESRPGPLLTLRQVEANYLQEVLRQFEGDTAACARALHVSQSTLYYKMSKHHITPRQFKGPQK